MPATAAVAAYTYRSYYDRYSTLKCVLSAYIQGLCSLIGTLHVVKSIVGDKWIHGKN